MYIMNIKNKYSWPRYIMTDRRFATIGQRYPQGSADKAKAFYNTKRSCTCFTWNR